MKQSAKIIGLALAILLLSTTIIFSYPSIREGAYTLGNWYKQIEIWLNYEKPGANDFKVHPWLALRAIQLAQDYYGIALTDEQKKLIILGSIEEDYDLKGTSSVDEYSDVKGSIDDSTYGDKLGTNPLQSARAVNHFMDSGGNGLHETIKGVVVTFPSALDWATSGKNLTRYSKAEDLAKSGDKNGWRFLGHVLHLLQDMATPAHVRNDQHAVFGGDNYETILSTVGTTKSELSDHFGDNYYDLLPSLPDSPVKKSLNDLFSQLSKHTRNNYYSDDSFNSSNYDNPSLTNGGNGYCYANDVPYKQGVAYYVMGKDCNYAKIDKNSVRVMFPDLASKAIAYGAGLIKLFYDATTANTGTNDVPRAVNDTNSVVEDTTSTITGNVLTNDLSGADTPMIFNGWMNTTATYGAFNGNSDGTYSYTLNNSLEAVHGLDDGQTLTESFNYSISDANGDLSSATLAITIIGTTDTGTCTGSWCEVTP